MTMSVTITSNPEEISNISTAIECLDFLFNFTDFPNGEISLEKVKQSRDYLSSLLSILNIKGMSIEDYQSLMNSLDT